MGQNLNIFRQENKDLLKLMNSELPVIMSQISQIVKLERGGHFLPENVGDIVASLLSIRNTIYRNAATRDNNDYIR